MGVTCFTQEFTTSVAPSRMFKALILDSHNLIPKIVPQGIKSIEFVEGDGGVGSIKQTNFPEGGHFKHLKHRIDTLDSENLVCKLEKVVYEVKFEASSTGGCVCKMTSEYHTKGDMELKEEEIKHGKDKAMGLYKVVEEYLVANPDVYA
ncbi:hypothetical protein CRG98_038940 [Punica granatum]|uniref:Bet v I/Major latex protein domain-containing protein n=1 Tax=Punica granatum TaxID=22663 RepID=A0A2I0I9K6_PUNGR|nr:hypothetical protein CRG98_038940 [Punica granatum]